MGVPDNVLTAMAQRMDELTIENDRIRSAQIESDMRATVRIGQMEKRLRTAEEAIDRLNNTVQGLMTLQGSTTE